MITKVLPSNSPRRQNAFPLAKIPALYKPKQPVNINQNSTDLLPCSSHLRLFGPALLWVMVQCESTCQQVPPAWEHTLEFCSFSQRGTNEGFMSLVAVYGGGCSSEQLLFCNGQLFQVPPLPPSLNTSRAFSFAGNRHGHAFVPANQKINIK